MKDRKRLVIYSALALPFVILVAFMAMMDPIARQTFFADLKANTVKQFGGKPDSGTVANEGAPSGVGGPSEAPGAGTQGGGFDPDQVFSRRDVDGDGKLSGDEIGERLTEELERLDTDQDGAISREEFSVGMRDRPGRGMGRPGRGGDFGGDPRAGKPERPPRPE